MSPITIDLKLASPVGSGVAERPAERLFETSQGGTAFAYKLNQFGEATIVAASTEAEELVVPSKLEGRRVVEVGDESFASFGSASFGKSHVHMLARGQRVGRNAALMCVVLPEGLASIGRGAFRGLARLRQVVLPSTLVEIRDYAFSCTDVRAISLPRACTHLSERSLRTGPEALPGIVSYYRSKLTSISVEPGNSAFCMVGPMLCRKVGENDRLETLMCVGRAESADLVGKVDEISESAFAGTVHIGKLRVAEGCRVTCADGLLPTGTCDELAVKLAEDVGGSGELVLPMPESGVSRAALAPTGALGYVDARAIANAYDAALLDAEEPLGQSRAILRRLAEPMMLAPEIGDEFRRLLDRRFEALCVHFGSRSDWQGFELMADAGLLDASHADTVVQTLTTLGDSAAASYVLGLKHRRFGKAVWDYDL